MTDPVNGAPVRAPLPRSTTHLRLPTHLTIEGDGVQPSKTKIIDTKTGKEVQIPIHALTFNVSVDRPNNVEIVLGDIAIRAECHFVQYTIDERDLRMLAKQNGFRIEAAPSYPARISHYGPAELQITFPNFPDLVVKHHNLIAREIIEKAEGVLFAYLQGLKDDNYAAPSPWEQEEGEILIWAHAPEVPDAEFAEVGEA